MLNRKKTIVCVISFGIGSITSSDKNIKIFSLSFRMYGGIQVLRRNSRAGMDPLVGWRSIVDDFRNWIFQST
jgi:hypothetical protein